MDIQNGRQREEREAVTVYVFGQGTTPAGKEMFKHGLLEWSKSASSASSGGTAETKTEHYLLTNAREKLAQPAPPYRPGRRLFDASVMRYPIPANVAMSSVSTQYICVMRPDNFHTNRPLTMQRIEGPIGRAAEACIAACNEGASRIALIMSVQTARIASTIYHARCAYDVPQFISWIATLSAVLNGAMRRVALRDVPQLYKGVQIRPPPVSYEPLADGRHAISIVYEDYPDSDALRGETASASIIDLTQSFAGVVASALDMSATERARRIFELLAELHDDLSRVVKARASPPLNLTSEPCLSSQTLLDHIALPAADSGPPDLALPPPLASAPRPAEGKSGPEDYSHVLAKSRHQSTDLTGQIDWERIRFAFADAAITFDQSTCIDRIAGISRFAMTLAAGRVDMAATELAKLRAIYEAADNTSHVSLTGMARTGGSRCGSSRSNSSSSSSSASSSPVKAPPPPPPPPGTTGTMALHQATENPPILDFLTHGHHRRHPVETSHSPVERAAEAFRGVWSCNSTTDPVNALVLMDVRTGHMVCLSRRVSPVCTMPRAVPRGEKTANPSEVPGVVDLVGEIPIDMPSGRKRARKDQPADGGSPKKKRGRPRKNAPVASSVEDNDAAAAAAVIVDNV